MQLKELGKTGVFLPEIGMGTSNYHGGPEPLRRGLEAGALFIDTAESYGSEPAIREAIAGLRDRIFLATKISPENFRADGVRKSVDRSLQLLGVETIDLLQLHYPNPAIPITETMGAIACLASAGKVRFAGVSNFSVAQMQEAQQVFPIVSNQLRYNIIDRTIEDGLLDYCRAHHITVIAYTPLARGLSRVMDCDPTGAIPKLAAALGKTPIQIVLNWCICKEGVIAIPKGTSTNHILENCGASGWRLTVEQVAFLDSRIQFRSRNRFDRMVRQYIPRNLAGIAARSLKFLPRDVRRRLT